MKTQLQELATGKRVAGGHNRRTSRMGGAVLVALALAGCDQPEVSTSAAPPAQVEPYAQGENLDTALTAWWWAPGQTAAQVNQLLSQHGARLTSLAVDNPSVPTFTVTMVPNSGSYAKTSTWTPGMTGSQISGFVANNAWRPTELVPYVQTVNGQQQLLFAATFVKPTGSDAKAWWWSPGVSASQVLPWAQANNARLVDLRQYTLNNQTWYAVLAISNSGADYISWWMPYIGAAPSTLSSATNNTGNYMIGLEPANGSGTAFNAIVYRNPGVSWWWYYGVNDTQLTQWINSWSARPYDLRSYSVNGQRVYSVLMQGDGPLPAVTSVTGSTTALIGQTYVCAQGAHYAPNSTVQLEYYNLPGRTAPLAGPFVDTDANGSFASDALVVDAVVSQCTPAQLAGNVIVQAFDDFGRVAESTFPAKYFCGNGPALHTPGCGY